LVIFIYDSSDFLPFAVLSRHVDIFLPPIHMHFEFDLVIDLRLQNEIIEPPTHKSVGTNISVCHVVLGSNLLLSLLHQF
jgi:hypothetical protein